MWTRAHENWGVLTAGKWTAQSWIELLSWINSHRNDSVKPRMAALAAQYADWSGIER